MTSAPSSEATPRPWEWVIHDYSMASIEGPKGEEHHVLSISPCESCERPDWQWGNCKVPSLADAALIVAAVNSYDERELLLRAALDYVDDCALGRRSGEGKIEREAAAEIAARIRAHLEGK